MLRTSHQCLTSLDTLIIWYNELQIHWPLIILSGSLRRWGSVLANIILPCRLRYVVFQLCGLEGSNKPVYNGITHTCHNISYKASTMNHERHMYWIILINRYNKKKNIKTILFKFFYIPLIKKEVNRTICRK